MAIKKIDCEHCGFQGKLTYQEDDYTLSDISICPVCGADISEKEQEEFDEEFYEED